MERRAWRFKRATLVIGLALAVLSNAVLATPGRAQQCDCATGCVGPCPEAIPVLETLGGNSLFWHDPCGNGYRDPDQDRLFHNAAPPVWHVSAEFLPLFRDQSGSQPFQAIASRTVGANQIVTYPRQAVLSTNDFDTGFDPGIRATIGRALGDWYRLEGSYFGSYSWSDSASVRFSPEPTPGGPGDGLLSPFSNFGNPNGLSQLGEISARDYLPSPLYDHNNYASIRFVSTMDDAQLNLRRRVRTAVDRQVRAETSCLLGLRYMNIAESFWYEARSPLRDGSQTRAVHTNNDLFGVQIGALSQFLVVDRGWIDFEIKGVIFFNDASNRIVSNFLVDPDPAQANRTSFLGDLSLNFNYQFAPAWTFRMGYNAMWLTGVALASENFFVNMDTLVTSPKTIDPTGNVVYHGPSIGLVFAR